MLRPPNKRFQWYTISIPGETAEPTGVDLKLKGDSLEILVFNLMFNKGISFFDLKRMTLNEFYSAFWYAVYLKDLEDGNIKINRNKDLK